MSEEVLVNTPVDVEYTDRVPVPDKLLIITLPPALISITFPETPKSESAVWKT